MAKFEDIVKELGNQYPNRNLEIRREGGNTYLYCDGEPQFCTTGYCMLYNLKRLCKVLDDELL